MKLQNEFFVDFIHLSWRRKDAQSTAGTGRMRSRRIDSKMFLYVCIPFLVWIFLH